MLVKRKTQHKNLDKRKIKNYNDCYKKKGVEEMKNGIAEIKEIKDISAGLTRETKKYVIAVANALLFSQNKKEPLCKPPKQTA